MSSDLRELEMLEKLKALKQRRHGMHQSLKRDSLDKEIATLKNKITEHALKNR